MPGPHPGPRCQSLALKEAEPSFLHALAQAATGAGVSHPYVNNTSAPAGLVVNVLAMDTTGAYTVAILPVVVIPSSAKE